MKLKRALFLVVFALATCVPVANASLILDQHNDGQNLGMAVNACCEVIAQTFTVGISGWLSAVSVKTNSGLDETMHVGIFETIGGAPGQEVLTSTTASPMSPLSTIIHFPTPLLVSVGDVLALGVWFPTVPSHVYSATWIGSTGEQYDSGGVFAGNLTIEDDYASPIVWNDMYAIRGYDVGFRTYIATPLPGTLSLLTGSLAILGLIRRRN